MPSCRSSSNQNTRVFAPTVLLSQDSTRIEITLTAGQGYTLPIGTNGITVGDCIRYDTTVKGYTGSKADSEDNAEVLGVVESITGGNCKVVISGSISYPTSRLAAIRDESGLTAGDPGNKVDILFLNSVTRGGLTANVEIPSGQNTAIVKPVIQLAPHGGYNGIVLNYIGYKIGNVAAAQVAAAPPGQQTFAAANSSPGEFWARNDSVISGLSVTDYSENYAIFGTSGGPSTVKITMTASTGISSTLVGKAVTQYQGVSNIVNIGTVVSVSGSTVTVTRSATSPTIGSGTIYINGLSFTPSTSTLPQVLTYSIPANEARQTLSDGTILYPWISLKPLTSISIPDDLTIGNLTCDSLDLGSVGDTETAINDILTRLTNLENLIAPGGS
jgi:hypothetical protein